MYYLFLKENNDKLNEICDKLNTYNSSYNHNSHYNNFFIFTMKYNTVLPACIHITCEGRTTSVYLEMKREIKNILLNIGYIENFQLLKIHSREQILV